jgi:hypothetical protein
MGVQNMTAQQAISFVKKLYPKAKAYRANKGRWIVHSNADFGKPFILGTWGGYCQVERAWKRAARYIKKGR